MSTYREKCYVISLSRLRTGIPKNKQTGLTNKFYITCKMQHKIFIDRMKTFSIAIISTHIEYFKKIWQKHLSQSVKKVELFLFLLVYLALLFRKISGKSTNRTAAIQGKLSPLQRNEKKKSGSLHKK